MRTSASGLLRWCPTLHALRAKYPGLRGELSLEDRLLDVSLEGLDVLLRAGDAVPVSTGIVARTLMSFPWLPVAAPLYLETHGTPSSPEALVAHDALSCHVAAGPDVWLLGDGVREARVVLTDAVVFRCAVLQAVRDVALSGQGIALLPDWFVHGDLERGVLRPVLPGWATERMPVSVLYRASRRPGPRVRAFLDHLAVALPEVPAPRSVNAG